MKSNTVFESAKADGELLAGAPPPTLAETGEVEIAGRRYLTPERLAKLLDKTPRTLAGLKQRFGESRVDLMAYGRAPWS
jgi:hypothetical protein